MLLIKFHLQKLNKKEAKEGINMNNRHPKKDGSINNIAANILIFMFLFRLLLLINFDFTYNLIYNESIIVFFYINKELIK